MKNLFKKTIKVVGRKLLRFADRFREPTIVGAEYIYGLKYVHGICPSAMLTVNRLHRQSEALISLGPGVWIGEDVEIEAIDPGSIVIGEATSIQSRCLIYGDVRIGSFCLFSRNVLVLSTIHKFRSQPEWLIHDQDRNFLDRASPETRSGIQVRIEDDCWFGWGSVIMPGIWVGRGAVIGANCVVTREVGPYEIHGGIPNRKIGTRLMFAAPASISAVNDKDLPYFYRGFDTRLESLSKSRTQGIVFAKERACIVLEAARGPHHQLVLAGISHAGNLQVRIQVNGHDLGVHPIKQGEFELSVEIDGTMAPRDRIPDSLMPFTRVELHCLPNAAISFTEDSEPLYGISAASLYETTTGA